MINILFLLFITTFQHYNLLMTLLSCIVSAQVFIKIIVFNFLQRRTYFCFSLIHSLSHFIVSLLNLFNHAIEFKVLFVSFAQFLFFLVIDVTQHTLLLLQSLLWQNEIHILSLLFEIFYQVLFLIEFGVRVLINSSSGEYIICYCYITR